MLYRTIPTLLLILFFAALRTGADGATVVVPSDYPAIQPAIGAASPGDTVLVKDGIYEENITVNKPVIIRSANGPEKTTVTAATKGLPTATVEGVEDFEFSGFTLTGSARAGLVVRSATDGRIANNVVTGNNNGIMIYASHRNAIEGNSGDANELYGIYLERSHDNTLEKNTANRNRDRGIFLSYSDRNKVIDNDANLNTWNGITLWESDDNEIRENLTLRNTYGIVIGNSTGNIEVDNSSLPNVYLVLPALLMYIGILSYLVQKNVLKAIYGGR